MITLACDLGGTRMKVGLVENGVVLAQGVHAVDSKRGLAPTLPILKSAWLALLQQHGSSWSECRGASLAFPSIVDTHTGRVLAEYGKYADAMSLDLRAWATDELGLPLAMDNDARMACIGEWRRGAGRGCDNLAMTTLGTGLGTGVILEGRALRGVHGQAGIMGGHFTVRYGGRICTCGNMGCAEAEASTARLQEIAPASLKSDGPVDYARIFQLARAGQSDAIALRDHSLQVWGCLAVNLIHAYDIERLILGGGIMGSKDVILPAICKHVEHYAHTPWGKVSVVASELKEHAALLAGEWLLDEQFPERKQ